MLFQNPGRVHHILCTGNICSKETTDWLQTVCPNVHFVRGDLDSSATGITDLPDLKNLKIGNFTFTLIHGHQLVPWGDPQVLLNAARANDVDILVHGHTHIAQVWKDEQSKKLLLNPGSATGAYSPFQTQVVPSYMLLNLRKNQATIYIYELRGNEVRVGKTEYVKT